MYQVISTLFVILGLAFSSHKFLQVCCQAGAVHDCSDRKISRSYNTIDGVQCDSMGMRRKKFVQNCKISFHFVYLFLNEVYTSSYPRSFYSFVVSDKQRILNIDKHFTELMLYMRQTVTVRLSGALVKNIQIQNDECNEVPSDNIVSMKKITLILFDAV